MVLYLSGVFHVQCLASLDAMLANVVENSLVSFDGAVHWVLNKDLEK